MRKLGNLDLSGNFLRNVCLEPVDVWPTDPQVGRFLNFRNRIYLCTELEGTDGLPVYIPVTSTVSTYLHNQSIASDTWLLQHGLNYDKPIVFIYDSAGTVIQPDEIWILDLNTVTLQFSMPVSGKAIVMCATDNLVNGGAANSGTGSNLPQAELDLLAKLTVADNVLKFDGKALQFQLENGEVVAALSVVDGMLAYNGQQVGKQLSNSDILAKFSVVNGILFYDGAQVDNVGDTFNNAAILSQLSVVNGELFYNGVKIDHVGDTYANSDVLQKLSAVDGVLFYDGIKVDTIGHTFDNQSVLDKFSVDANGKLLFNGAAISSGSSLTNSALLEQITDNGGVLYYKGTLIGSQGTVNLTINNTGSGQAVLSSIVGTQINAKTLVAGSNVTLNSTSDTITINSTLGGTVTASTTFKTTDVYTNTNVVANSANTQLLATEALTSETGLLFLARLGSDAKSNTKDVALPTTGSVTPNSTLASAPNGVATLFNNGRLTVANGTTYTDTSPATWFAGTVDWTIECDIVRDTSKLGVSPQNIVSGWNAYISQSSVWIGLDANNKVYASVSNGTSSIGVVGTTTIADSNKHHIEVNRSGGTLRLFIDGALAGSVAFTGSIPAGTGFWIGNSGDSAIPFYGYLRNVKVYNYAKHTSAYTVAGYYADRVGTVNTVDMAGKLLSSAFWKTVTSLAVTSTETASAYLKWMMRTADGTVYKWDTTTSSFIADASANILTAGVTTTQMVAALASYGWNYKSDNIGFVVAFVTTDGASTPVLTSLTLTAVQSADKTAGHTIVNSQGNALNQRTNLKFVGVGVSDDPTNNQTVVTGVTDSSGMTHNSASMATVLNALQAGSGTVNGKSVDLTNLTDGSTLTYNQASNTFKVAQPATGASGQGLYMTTQFTVNAGQEVTVSHQSISNGRAIYQADAYYVGSAGSLTNRFSNSYDATLSGTVFGASASYDTYSPVRLPYTYESHAKGSASTFPVIATEGCGYIVDQTIYVFAGGGNAWAAQTAIYSAPLSAPTTWTLAGNTPVGVYLPMGNRVYKYNNALYLFGGASTPQTVYSASVDAPTVWSAVGTIPIAMSGGSAFIVGTRVYLVGGQGSTYAPINTIYSADMSSLNNWTKEANTFPIAVGRSTCYQYGNYLYMLGGEITYDTTMVNTIYRASTSAPTVWAAIGTLPAAIGSADEPIIYGGKVFIFGGRSGSTTLTSVYYADASNPVSWTTGTAMSSARQFAAKVLANDTAYIIGGFTGSVWLSSVESYVFTNASSVGSGTMTLNTVNTALMQTISDVNIYAKIPASTSVQAAVSFDGGTTWSYYNTSTSGWVVAASQAAALSAGAALTLVSGYKYIVTGLTNYSVGTMQNIQIALLLTSTVVNTSPIIYYTTFSYLGIGTYGTLLIGSYGNGYADIGIKHPAGTYNTTNVKNNQGSPLTMILKICDGTTTV